MIFWRWFNIKQNCTWLTPSNSGTFHIGAHPHIFIVQQFSWTSKELFYQLALKGFSNFGFIHLSQPAPIYDLVMIALEEEDLSEWGEGMPSKEEIGKV